MAEPESADTAASPEVDSPDAADQSSKTRWSSRTIIVAFLVFVVFLLSNGLLIRHLTKPTLVAVDLIGHKKGVNDIAFSHDGNLVATASDDQTMRLWSTDSGEAIRTFQGHSKRITEVKFRPYGGEIATASDDQTVRIWELETGIEVRSLRGHEKGGITALEFSPDAATLVTCGGDKTIRLWNYADGTERLKIDTGAVMKCVAVHPTDPLLATGGWDKKVRIIDTGTGDEVSVMDGHWGVVEAVAFSPDGRLLCSASRDETVRLWDVESAKQSLFISRDSAVSDVSFTSNGTHIVSCDHSGLVLVHHAHTGDEVMMLVGHPDRVLCVACHPVEEMIASGGWGRSAILWKK